MKIRYGGLIKINSLVSVAVRRDGTQEQTEKQEQEVII